MPVNGTARPANCTLRNFYHKILHLTDKPRLLTMNIDIPHALITALLIFLVLISVKKLPAYQKASTGKRTFIAFIALFAVIFVFNLFWPYGS